MSSTSEQYNMPSTSEDSILINKAAKKISFLVHKLTDQLRIKESLMAEALDQSQMLTWLSVMALHDDTVPWDPHCAPQSRSIPQTSQSVVQIRGRPDPLQAEGPLPAPIQAPVPLQAEEPPAPAASPPPPATDSTSTIRRRLVHDAVRRRSSTPHRILYYSVIPRSSNSCVYFSFRSGSGIDISL